MEVAVFLWNCIGEILRWCQTDIENFLSGVVWVNVLRRKLPWADFIGTRRIFDGDCEIPIGTPAPDHIFLLLFMIILYEVAKIRLVAHWLRLFDILQLTIVVTLHKPVILIHTNIITRLYFRMKVFYSVKLKVFVRPRVLSVGQPLILLSDLHQAALQKIIRFMDLEICFAH